MAPKYPYRAHAGRILAAVQSGHDRFRDEPIQKDFRAGHVVGRQGYTIHNREQSKQLHQPVQELQSKC